MPIALRRRPLTDLYDATARTWHGAVDRLGYPAAYRLLIETAPMPAGSVLDAGCGSGHFALAWIRRVGAPVRLTLLDPSQAMLDEAASRVGLVSETVNDGIGCDAIAPGGMDAILCAHVIEHLDDPESALAWVLSRLRPGGRLYLAASQPHWCTAILQWRWGHRAIRPHEMRAMLRRAGFAGVREVAFAAGPPSRTSRGYIADRPLLEGGGALA